MLFQRDIFALDGRRLRLVNLDTATGTAWCHDIDDELAWPEPLTYADIQDLPVQEQAFADTINPSPARLKHCDEAWARLEPLLLEHGTNLLLASTRNFALETHAEKIGCSKRTLYKDLRRYWQRGMTKYALLPDYNKSGRPSHAQEEDAVVAITAGRGRKAANGSAPYQLTTADAKHLTAIIQQEYLRAETVTTVDAYTTLIKKHYCYEDGNLDRHVNPVGARPSLRQFQHFLKKNFDIEVRKRSRHGDSDYEREHRKVLGTVMSDCLGVGHYYEIDATIADVYLVSTESTKHIIGKPTIYLIIDRKSRLIAGFYLGLENASWNGAMQAILSISEDKQKLCEMYGVKYDPADWPAHQVFPMEFLADRGDMISKASTSLTERLQVTVTNLPSKRPDWKPLVECGFKLIHQAVRPIAPAYDPPSNATRRRGKHYEKDACLTLKEFGNVLLNAVIKHNRREILDYPMSIDELMAGIRPSPIALWNHGILTRSGQLSRFDFSHVQFSLLREAIAVVTEHGVEFKGCVYTFPEAISNKWFERARSRRFNVKVSYDTRLVDSIYVHALDEKGQPNTATLTDRSSGYAGLSFEEVGFYESYRKSIRRESKEQRLSNTLELQAATESTVEAAKHRLKAEAKGISRSARRAYVKPKRHEERSLERQATVKLGGHSSETQAKVVALHVPPPAQSTASTSAPNTMSERLAAARAKMLA